MFALHRWERQPIRTCNRILILTDSFRGMSGGKKYRVREERESREGRTTEDHSRQRTQIISSKTSSEENIISNVRKMRNWIEKLKTR